MATEKQIAANRQNSLRSTGPRSPAGKHQSKRNRTKHGLSGAGECLPDDLRDELSAEIELFSRTYKPRDHVEMRCVERMARATVRMLQVGHQQLAAARDRRRRAFTRWDARRDELVAEQAARLPQDPAGAVAALRETAEGCDYLADRWEPIREALERGRPLTPRQADRAVALLGLAGRGRADGDPEVAGWALDLLGATAPTPTFLLAEYLGVSPEEASRQAPPIEAARAALLARVTAHIAELQARADELWHRQDQPAREEAAARVLVDTSQAGALLDRYHGTAALEYRRASQELFAHRKAMKAQAEEDRPMWGWTSARNEPNFEPQVVDPEPVVAGTPAAPRGPAAPSVPPPVTFPAPESDGRGPDSSTDVNNTRPESPPPPR